MKIRQGTPSDHKRLLDIWLRSVRATHRFLAEEDVQFLLPLVRDQALIQLELWVLVADNDQTAGFMGLDGNKLEALFLDPAFHRRGFGRQLVDHARALHGPLEVDVNEQNPEALEFYKAMGFTVRARSPLDATGKPFPILHMRESRHTENDE